MVARDRQGDHAGRLDGAAEICARPCCDGLDESDADNTIEIVPHDPNRWLTSCTNDDLQVGDNLAARDEVIQFGEVTALGAGRFRLGRLFRGRAGTTSTAHSRGEPFVLLEHGALQPIMLPVWKRGSPVWASGQHGAI